jgi:uncharacterized iron-regulated membrane protein
MPGGGTRLIRAYGEADDLEFMHTKRGTAGTLTARYLKKKRWWLKTHRVLGIVGPTPDAVGIGVAVFMGAVQSGIHLRGVHSWFGLFALLLILLSPVFGQAFLKV